MLKTGSRQKKKKTEQKIIYVLKKQSSLFIIEKIPAKKPFIKSGNKSFCTFQLT